VPLFARQNAALEEELEEGRSGVQSVDWKPSLDCNTLDKRALKSRIPMGDIIDAIQRDAANNWGSLEDLWIRY